MLIDKINPEAVSGLSEQEAAERLKAEGPNELPSSKQRGLQVIALEILSDPIFLLLLVSGIIYLFLGDIQEAMMLLGFVFFIMGITFYQEFKTERSLEALRDLTSPRANVIRSGKQSRIAGRDVVRGDILILAEGDRIPADSVVLSSTYLLTNESLLTGESVPVRKAAWDGSAEIGRPGGDGLPFVYSGTMVVRGQGVARVLSTGSRTEIGKIGKNLQTLQSEETLLQKETRRLVRVLAVVGLSLCAVVVIVYGMTRGNWLQGFLAGIALAMAILPNEFPVVLTIFLALGAWRMSKRRVLTRHIPAIESLGSATVLCVDKTGTLTLNRMSVRKMFAQGEFYDAEDNPQSLLSETFHSLVEFSILGSQKNPFDPMESALKAFGERHLADTEHLHHDWNLIREYPLSQELLALSHVWESPDGEDFVIAAKGAPEAIFDLCHFDEKKIQQFTEKVQSLANDALRVLAIAKSRFKKPALPGKQHDFEFEFLGLVGFEDPVRPSAKAAVSECRNAGIQVVMITGDYPRTARNIANQIGISSPEKCITGPELERMDDRELRQKIKSVHVFARIVPEQKLRLVNAFKANGEIVGMTGDGVNDAPALRAAHIGIAMGERGTDVARESADIVLLDDDFSSIVQAVKLGRRIYDNLKKAIAYLLAIHIPIAGISLIPVFFKWPLVLMPVHIAFLHLIIDPACSVVFEAEPEEKDVMNRPPRNPQEPLYNHRTLRLCVLQGAAILLVIAVVFITALYRGLGELDARALTFTTLIIANIGLILTNRSWSQNVVSTFRSSNPALWWVTGGALIFLLLVLYVPFLRGLFRFSLLHPIDLAICFGAGLISVLWFEFFKITRKRENFQCHN